MNWTKLKVVRYFFIYTHFIVPKNLSMPMDRAYLTCSYSLRVMNSQQKNPYSSFMCKICTPTKNCPALLRQSISIPTMHTTQPMFSAATEIPRLGAIHLGTLYPSERHREYISLEDKQGILVPWTTQAFTGRSLQHPNESHRHLAPTKCHWTRLLIFPRYNYYTGRITFTVIPNCRKTWRPLLQLCFPLTNGD